jgi:murein DD-endopeptidase MepM/ murein hydrolase activator NlpD
LNSFSVSVGTNVSQGQRIGTVGSTGGSTGLYTGSDGRVAPNC